MKEFIPRPRVTKLLSVKFSVGMQRSVGTELTFHSGGFVLLAPSCCFLWVWKTTPTFQELDVHVPADRIYFKRSFPLPTVIFAPPVVVSHSVNSVLVKTHEE